MGDRPQSNRPPRARRWLRRWAVRGIALGVAALVIVLGALAITIVRYGATDRARPADVIIVLGGGDEGTARRAGHGAALYHAGYAAHVLCTGGVSAGGAQIEAERCAQVMRAARVPAEAVTLERGSHSTAENARATAAIMDAQGWRDAVLVSDDFHLWRARWLFERQGVRVYPSPAQGTSGPLAPSEQVYGVLREIAAWGWGEVRAQLGG
ncbi:MAG: YdcF family protein [Anaerolineae bacterium]|nr:YdcF family protein [Anaerolineae bacterium]